MLARWYDEGVDAFRTSPADGRELLRRFGETLAQLADEHARGDDQRDQELDVLLAETRASHEQMAELIRAGRDHLLELAASRDLHADELAQAFPARTRSVARRFPATPPGSFGIHTDELGSKVLVLDPQYLSTDALPGFAKVRCPSPLRAMSPSPERICRCCGWITRMIVGAMDLALSSERGNAAFMVDDVLPPRSALLQAVYVLECVAERHLDAERFLPTAADRRHHRH